MLLAALRKLQIRWFGANLFKNDNNMNLRKPETDGIAKITLLQMIVGRLCLAGKPRNRRGWWGIVNYFLR